MPKMHHYLSPCSDPANTSLAKHHQDILKLLKKFKYSQKQELNDELKKRQLTRPAHPLKKYVDIKQMMQRTSAVQDRVHANPPVQNEGYQSPLSNPHGKRIKKYSFNKIPLKFRNILN